MHVLGFVMKRAAVVLAALLLAAACSSTSQTASGPRAKIADPELSIEQLHGPADEAYPAGPIEVQYELTVGNKADVPMTLTRVQIRTVNPAGGAYSLQPRAYYFNTTIPPHSDGSVQFWAKGVFYGRSSRESEPVTIQGTAYFSTPTGHYDKVFVGEIAQY